jgi:SNF2 family DNA or RNA helicase
MSSKKCLPLFNHQKKAVDFITARGGSGALFHEMGLGKTRTAIEILAHLRKEDPNLRMLVIAPISLLEAAWAADVRDFSDFTFWNLRNGWGIEGKIREDIMAINYEFFIANSATTKEKIKRLVKFIEGMTKAGAPWMCVLDESSRIKNAQAATTKTLLAMAKFFKYRIIMSGTPAPNTELEYWAQLNFAIPESLGKSLTVFRSKFFHFVNRYSKAESPIGGFTSRMQAVETYKKCDIAISDTKRRELMEMIKPYCHMAKKKDCLDLPEQVDEIRNIEMEPDQATAYRTLERFLVLEIQKQVIAVPVALSKLMKLRQITSGFIYNQVGEAFETGNLHGTPPTGDQVYLDREFKNPKIRELLDVIEEAGDQPVIIWIQFHWEIIKICHELHKRWPGQVVTISSMTKDRDESILAFQQGRARFLVAHPASAAHGLTFVNCSLQIFFSIDYSLEKYEQARARTHRAGQKNICTYIHLIAKGTIDEIILEALHKKGDIQKLVYEALVGKGAGNGNGIPSCKP